MSAKKERKNVSKKDSESEEDELNDVVAQKIKKSTKPKKSDKKTKKKVDDETQIIDENENQEVVEDSPDESKNVNVPNERNNVRELIDSTLPIQSLTTLQILNYLIQVGNDTCNPTLKFGSIKLLRELRGIRPHRHNNNYHYSNNSSGYHNRSKSNRPNYGSKSRSELYGNE